MAIRSLAALAEEANRRGVPLFVPVAEDEAAESGASVEEVRGKMAAMLLAMRESVHEGIAREGRSVSGLTGGEAARYHARIESGESLLGHAAAKAAAYALAASCVNASMGRIVAAPTAGSCGILPGVLIALQEWKRFPDDAIVSALLTAAGVGQAISVRATLSGAAGGCQAECGSAGAMAAAAACELMGGSPDASLNAAALALKNSLGLVCDPVAGLVEVPCVKRNAVFAVAALTAADMALAGIESVIPADEVIDAMYSIGQAMPAALRETAKGGLAATPTGCRLKATIFSEK